MDWLVASNVESISTILEEHTSTEKNLVDCFENWRIDCLQKNTHKSRDKENINKTTTTITTTTTMDNNSRTN